MSPPTVDVRVLPDLPDTAPTGPDTARRQHGVTAPTDGATALDPAITPSPEQSTDLRVLPGGATERTGDDDDHQHLLMRARRFVQAVVEIVSGDRPCTQLIRWTDREVYDSLTTRVSALAGTTGSVPAVERPRAKVVSVKVCRPCDGVAEVAAHVRQGRRSHALAARLEQAERRWVCTALELG